jgi:hypothetical protein
MNRESLVIERGNAPLHSSSQWCPRDPFALRAGADQGTFKLGEGGHHREDHFALRRRGIDVFLMKWLRVLGTTETPQIDQGVRHQLHPIMALLHVLEPEQ